MYLENGTLLQSGKYRIVRFIASGGFGCTYEAVHTSLGKRVAIKEFFVKDFCNRDATTNLITTAATSKTALVEKLRRKFEAEARTIAGFSHPNIVTVSDIFHENGTIYYVMHYIEGKSLQQIVSERGRLSQTEAVDYIR